MKADANYNAAQQDITKSFLSTVFNKDVTAWCQWQHFCSWIQISPDLEGIEDPIPLLHIFADCVCDVLLSAQGHPIKKLLVKQCIRLIGKMFTSVGSNNPHHKCMKKLDFWLGRHLAPYKKEDSPPTRVRPLQVNVMQALDTTAQGTTPMNTAIGDLTLVSFFFFL